MMKEEMRENEKFKQSLLSCFFLDCKRKTLLEIGKRKGIKGRH